MNPDSQDQPQEDAAERQPYERPELRRIKLTTEETLAGGCKLGTDPDCTDNDPILLPGS